MSDMSKAEKIREYQVNLGHVEYAVAGHDDLLTVYIRDVMGQRFIDIASGRAQTVIGTLPLNEERIEKVLEWQKRDPEHFAVNNPAH